VISSIVVIASVIAGYAVMRSNVNKGIEVDKSQDEKITSLVAFMNSKGPVIEQLLKIEESYGKKLDVHSNKIIELTTQLGATPTMKEVRDEFVSKEVFLQMEKHIDQKFLVVTTGINEILKELKEK